MYHHELDHSDRLLHIHHIHRIHDESIERLMRGLCSHKFLVHQLRQHRNSIERNMFSQFLECMVYRHHLLKSLVYFQSLLAVVNLQRIILLLDTGYPDKKMKSLTKCGSSLTLPLTRNICIRANANE